jgi:hypothetical protein
VFLKALAGGVFLMFRVGWRRAFAIAKKESQEKVILFSLILFHKK